MRRRKAVIKNVEEIVQKITEFYTSVLPVTKKEARGLVLMQILKYKMIFLPLPDRYMIIEKEVRDGITTIYDPRRDEISLFFENRLFTTYRWEDRGELYREFVA